MPDAPGARPADEHLAERRHRIAGQRAERRIVGRHVAPAEHRQPLGLGDLRRRTRTPRRRPGTTAAGRRCRWRSCPLAGSSKSTTARRNSSGTCSRMPAPSPVFGSAPWAPRCSRFSSAVMALSTMSRLRRPCMSATIATPHESCSYAGLYSPCMLGRHSHLPFSTTPSTSTEACAWQPSRDGVCQPWAKGCLRAALNDGLCPIRLEIETI